MLGHEGDGRHHERNPVPAATADLIIGCRTDPFQRPDAALITDLPIDPRPVQGGDHRRGGRLHLARIGVASAHDPLWQTMRREEQAWRLILTGSRVEKWP